MTLGYISAATAAKKHIARLYTDLAEIYRHSQVDNDDGSSDYILPDAPIYANIPCRISFERIDPPFEQAEGGRPITTSVKIFADPKTDIKAGDYINVARGNEVYSGSAGQPAMYESHLEVTLTHRDRA